MFDFTRESLRQNLFWLRILQEHMLFIRLGLPCEEEALRAEAMQLENQLRDLLGEAQKLQKNPNELSITELNREAIALTTAVIDYKSRVLRQIICCKIVTGFNLPLLIDHVRREALFYRATLVRLQNNLHIDPVENLLQEETFWLRIMADHSKFIAHLFDPSERRFINAADDFSRQFDELHLHAMDLESMLVPQSVENSFLDETARFSSSGKPAIFGRGLPEPYSIGALESFTGEVLETITKLRNFKQAGSELISNCRVLSIIPPLLADHVLREAERALEELALRRRILPPPCTQY